MPKTTGYETAVRAAVEKLRTIDLSGRCARLGLPNPQDGLLEFRAFGTDMVLRQSDFELFQAGTHTPARESDRILILHYLLCDLPIPAAGENSELISFRQFDSGMFYWEAYLSRGVRPLVERIGNDPELLKRNLARFDWQPVPLGDLGARIHAVGSVYITLIYRLGDEEFPPSADLLFDAGIKRVFPTEDVAVLAGRICLGLL
ncbi:MAG: hypothetical protein QG657_2869 [Acidobacteriota bacterium]|nr:hypothetical protein [Acidobacteriota bacterium]